MMMRQLIIELSFLAQLAHCPALLSSYHNRLILPSSAWRAKYPGHDFQTSNKSIRCQLICRHSNLLLPCSGPVACRHAERISTLRFALTVSPCRLAFSPSAPSGTNAKLVKRKSCFSSSDRPYMIRRFFNGWLLQGPFVCGAGLLVCQRLRLNFRFCLLQ